MPELLEMHPIFQPVSGNLGGKAARGGVTAAVAQTVKFALGLVSTMVLARLLLPSDFGVIAMTTVLIMFFQVFRDGGLGMATVASIEISPLMVSNLFWLNTALGSLLALFCVSISHPVADFYGNEALVAVVAVMSLTFVFGGLSVQHSALLRRQMRFFSIAAIEIGAVIVNAVVSVILAFSDFGFWALVWGGIAASAASCAGVWLAARWIPKLPSRAINVMPMLKFGTDILTYDIANYFSRHFDKVLVGKIFGAEILGLYDKSHRLMMLPFMQVSMPLGSVAVPALSRIASEPKVFRRCFLEAVELVSLMAMPLIVCVCVFADLIVFVVLGPNWLGSVVFFRLLAVAVTLRTIMFPIGWLMIANGTTRRYRTLGLASSILIVVCVIMGAMYSAHAVATAYSIGMAILFFPSWLYALVGSSITLKDVMRSYRVPFLSCVGAFFIALFWMWFSNYSTSDIRLKLFSPIVFFVVYLLLVFWLFGRWSLLDSFVKRLRNK